MHYAGILVNLHASFLAEITCSELTAPENGQITYDQPMATRVQFQTTATYTCSSGYGLTGGNRSRVCDGDGSSYLGYWTDTAPSCEGKQNCVLVLCNYTYQL